MLHFAQGDELHVRLKTTDAASLWEHDEPCRHNDLHRREPHEIVGVGVEEGEVEERDEAVVQSMVEAISHKHGDEAGHADRGDDLDVIGKLEEDSGKPGLCVV